ncbi:MAG: hypothetical protein HY799_01820 [Nitrosomonadales bacterium]|nr:hypothetical protein [Nitrosomonadales bacterium]
MNEALATKAAEAAFENSPQDKATPIWKAKDLVLTAATCTPLRGRSALHCFENVSI